MKTENKAGFIACRSVAHVGMARSRQPRFADRGEASMIIYVAAVAHLDDGAENRPEAAISRKIIVAGKAKMNMKRKRFHDIDYASDRIFRAERQKMRLASRDRIFLFYYIFRPISSLSSILVIINYRHRLAPFPASQLYITRADSIRAREISTTSCWQASCRIGRHQINMIILPR